MKYTFPIPENQQYRITQKFGENLLDYTKICYDGECLIGHNGVDIAVLRGTPVVACTEGDVIQALTGALPGGGGYGNQVAILETTESGYREWVYAHALSVFVKIGDHVNKGDVIMLADNTGMSTGDHLHFGKRERDKNKNVLNYNNGYFGYSDPMPLFELMEEERLPVDNRYGQDYSYTRELTWKLVHETYAKKKAEQAGFKYDDRFMKAHVYGFWPGNGEDSIYNVSYFAIWANMTYLAWKKIKGLPGGKTLTQLG